MIDTNELIEQVDKGIAGLNEGLPNGLTELNKYVYGLQKGRYILLGGESGSGKTTFADFTSMLVPYFYCKNNNISIDFIYYSFELSKVDKMAKVCSFLCEHKYKLRVSPDKILGRTKDKLNEEQYNIVKEVSTIVKEMFDNIYFITENINCDGIYKQILDYTRKNGIFEGTNYIPNDPNKWVVIIIDHIGLVDTSKKHPTLKESMDMLSKYLVHFRNKFGYTSIVVQQFNTELTSTHRKQQTEKSIAPQRLDFADSKYTYRDF